MSVININVSGDMISGNYGKTQFAVAFDETRYKEIVKLQEKAEKVKKVEELNPIFEKFEDLTKVSFKELIETKCPYIVYNEHKKKFYLKNDGVTSSIAIPKVLAERIIESAEKNVDFMPLVKLWIRFLRNPILRGYHTSKNKHLEESFAHMFATYINTDFINYDKVGKLMEEQGVTQEVAIKFSSVKDVCITQEGLLCTYKAVNEITTKYALDADGNKIIVDRYEKTIDPDTGIVLTKKPDVVEDRLFEPPVMHQNGDAFYCEGSNGYVDPCHFVKVGCEVRLPDWSYVDCDSNKSCVKGLHCGGLTYIKGYQGSGTETFNCFVDPMFIGAFDHSGNGAIRVLRYFVHSALDMVNGNMYHSSTYAAKTDEEWAKLRKEVVEFFSKKRKETIENQDNEINEINALD